MWGFFTNKDCMYIGALVGKYYFCIKYENLSPNISLAGNFCVGGVDTPVMVADVYSVSNISVLIVYVMLYNII
jgi:hypothetical protein